MVYDTKFVKNPSGSKLSRLFNLSKNKKKLSKFIYYLMHSSIPT